jgi:hypothetical protein
MINPFKRKRRKETYIKEMEQGTTRPDWYSTVVPLESKNAGGIPVLNLNEPIQGQVYTFLRRGLFGPLRKHVTSIYTTSDGSEYDYKTNATNIDEGREHPKQKRVRMVTAQPSENMIIVARKRDLIARIKREPKTSLYISNEVAIQAERDQLETLNIKREVTAR